MGKIGRILVGLFLIAILAVVGAGFYLKGIFNHGKAQLWGTLEAPGLQQEAKVIRDKYGVPHIYADSDHDLYFAVGFIQAQDRLWQMDLMRRIAKGELSEVFGIRPQDDDFTEGLTTYDVDLFSRAVGFYRYGKMMEETMDDESRDRMQAYCDGVNAFIEKNKGNLPPEFELLGYKPAPWTPYDSAAISKYVAWGLSADWDLELMRMLAREQLGEQRMWQLLPLHKDPGNFVIPREVKDYSTMQRKKADARPPDSLRYASGVPTELLSGLLARHQALETGGNGRFRTIPASSNNWVVSGDRSESGKPILANDPHLPHLVPSVFYLMHQIAPGINATGVGFPGQPFVVLGHNEQVAWAATTAWADTEDIFIEKVNPDNPNEYEYNGEWVPFEIQKETIRFKKGLIGPVDEKTVSIRVSRHGPILNDAMIDLIPPSAPPLALRWAGHFPANDAANYAAIDRAKSVHEIFTIVKRNGAPISNILAADTEGSIGYFPLGFIPDRKKGDGSFPVPGWTGEYDWRDGWVPPEELPHSINPGRGYLVTANNKIVPEEDFPHTFSTSYMPHYRAFRIENLLTGKEKHTAEDMRQYQLDVKSLQAERLLPVLLPALKGDPELNTEGAIYAQALAILSAWNFETAPDEPGASIFYRLYGQIMHDTLADDLSDALYKRYIKSWTLEAAFDNALESGDYPFFDDAGTKDVVEDRDAIAAAAFKKIVNALKQELGDDPAEWKWGKLHTMTFSHTLGAQKPLDMIFNDGPYPIGGARGTVKAGLFSWGHEKFDNLYGPSWRFTIDMADPAGARMVLDAGNAGHVLSRHYLDLGKLWLKGDTIPMLFDREDVEKEAEGTLTLAPSAD